MSRQRTACPNVGAVRCLIVCGGESFGLKTETAAVLEIVLWSLHLIAWPGQVSSGQ